MISTRSSARRSALVCTLFCLLFLTACGTGLLPRSTPGMGGGGGTNSVVGSFNKALGFNGAVGVLTVLGSRLYVGGSFIANGPQKTPYITAFNGNSPDAHFPSGDGFDGIVYSIVPAADGSGDVYIGGAFTSYNGTPNVNNLVRLNSDGSIDTAFNIGSGSTAGFNGGIFSIATAKDGSGDVYVGGSFASYNNTPNVNFITRLNADGSVDTAFNTGSGVTAGFDFVVYSIAPADDATGDVYVGGFFSSYNGTANVKGIARLNSDGSIDTAFDIGSGVTAGFDTFPVRIALAGDGSGDVYVGGIFSSYNNTPNVNNIVRLNSDGSIDSGFNIGSGATAGFNGQVQSVAPVGDGSGDVYVGGGFTSYNNTPDVRRITRLNPDGSIDAGFNTGNGGASGFNGFVGAIAPAGDGSGSIYVGGSFTSYNSTPEIRKIARLNSDGSIDTTFNADSRATSGFDSWVYSIALARDDSGDVYAGGNFTTYNQVSDVNRITRLNADGSIDAGFNIGSGSTAGFNGPVATIVPAIDGSGDVYVGGQFTSYNGTPDVRNITRLNPDGSIDAGFNTGSGGTAGFNNIVLVIALADDGSGDVYVGGAFTSYNGTTNINRITRLNPDGSVDATFNTGSGASAGFSAQVARIVPAADGSGDIYVGGSFNSYNSTPDVWAMTRLNSDGSIDSAFNIGSGSTAGFNGPVGAIALASDASGDVYVGGGFTSYNNTPDIRRITRLNSDGSIDMGFNTGSGAAAGFNNFVSNIASAVDGSGDVYVVGNFASYNGTVNVRRITRLNSDGSIDTAFNTGSGATAGFDYDVYYVVPAVDGSGAVYIGGNFSVYNAVTHAYISLLSKLGVSL
jgi:uncharacterized delta-60 repeat protein